MGNQSNKEKQQDTTNTRDIHDKAWIGRALLVVLADVLAAVFSYFIALLFRFDYVYSNVPEEYLIMFCWLAPLWCLFTVVVFYIFRLYRHRRLYHKGTLLRQQADTLPASYPQNA